MHTLNKASCLLLLISGAILASYAMELQVFWSHSAQAQTTQVQTQAILVLLPSYTQIILRDGSSMSGNLTGFDVSSQQLTLSRGDRSQSVLFTQVERVTFQTDDSGVPGRGVPPIRGERRTWSGVPVNNFRILNASQGQAEIRLPLSIDSRISSDHGVVYALEEFSFSSENELDIGIIVLE